MRFGSGWRRGGGKSVGVGWQTRAGAHALARRRGVMCWCTSGEITRCAGWLSCWICLEALSTMSGNDRGVEQRQLARLITWRSEVRILPPLFAVSRRPRIASILFLLAELWPVRFALLDEPGDVSAP